MLSMLNRDWLSHFILSSSNPNENLSVDFSLTSKSDFEDEAFYSLEVGVVFLVSLVVSLSPSSENNPLEASLSWSLKVSRL
jgi:hypothetical protein